MNFVSYKNGNYTVHIDLDTGTKIRVNDLDNLTPSFPESMDIKITDYCDMECKMCHENSGRGGRHGDIMSAKFIDSLHPYTELAIGGGNPLSHPDLEEFLRKCKELKLVPSMTVHQAHFMKNLDTLRRFRDEKLIYGLGVSLSLVNDDLIDAIKEFPNAVIHVINGLVTAPILNEIAHQNLKILILGYKLFRRGDNLYKKDYKTIDYLKDSLYELLPTIIEEKWFDVVSFDNLAIEQLNPNRLMSEEEYSKFYMGDDGSHTMYVDMVKGEFAVSSTAPDRYPILDTVEAMFEKVAKISGHTTFPSAF